MCMCSTNSAETQVAKSKEELVVRRILDCFEVLEDRMLIYDVSFIKS